MRRKKAVDVLYIDDLVFAYEAFVARAGSLKGRVFNLGGGPACTMSLLELIAILEKDLGRKVPAGFSDWRPADQKVYVSDIRRAKAELGWIPKVELRKGSAASWSGSKHSLSRRDRPDNAAHDYSQDRNAVPRGGGDPGKWEIPGLKPSGPI